MRRGFVVALLLAGCAPNFEPHGSVRIDGVPFEPVKCHVLPSGGIQLYDAVGQKLELALPPMRLDAFRQIRGTPSATFLKSGAPGVSVGACGELVLTGEGYHGGGRRAASGSVSLDCAGPPRVEARLEFQGCF